MTIFEEYEQRHGLLKQAYWFAEHKMVDTAIFCIEEAFNNFVEFRAWYLNESIAATRYFSEYFVKWVAKIMIAFYNGHCSKDDQELVNTTVYEVLVNIMEEDAENTGSNV